MTKFHQQVSGQKEEVFTLALAGQPNVGKSTIFNMLTGLDQHVGNWPGKTVECKTGHIELYGNYIHLIDLPGTYSLTANSEEERITREFIIHEKPDVVIAIVNAALLERNLYLVTELLALHVPIVLGLNMMDVAQNQGFQIDPKVLQVALGIDVIPVIAARNQGLVELLSAAIQLARSPSTFDPNRPEIRPEHLPVLNEIRSLITEHIPQPFHEDWVTMKLLEGDSQVMSLVKTEAPEAWDGVQKILLQHEDAILDITGGRYEWIGRMVRVAVFRPRPGTIVWTDRLDRVATHPFWGFVLLLGVFGLVFWLTFVVANPLMNLLNTGVVLPLGNFTENVLKQAPAWISGLIVDGLIGGVGTVLTFIPVLVLFFLILGILEDIGYLARSAYVMDPFMHTMGLHGRSFLPLFLGFGCNVPAVTGTRIIDESRPRLLTILLVPFMPCTARMAVIAFIAPAFFGDRSAFVTWLLVTGNLMLLHLVGVSINRFILKGKRTPFVMEMPLYHIPNLRTIGLSVWQNIYAFIKKAGGIIVVFTVILWALSWFPTGDINTSLLAHFGRWMEPFGQLMGFNDWRLLVSLVTSFIAKENTIASLGVLYGMNGTGMGLRETLSQVMTPAAGFAFLVVQMLFVPCVATVAVIKQETASWKMTVFSVMLLLLISISAGIGVYQLARLLNIGM